MKESRKAGAKHWVHSYPCCATCSSFAILARGYGKVPPAGECLDLESPRFTELFLGTVSKCEFWLPNEQLDQGAYTLALVRNDDVGGALEMIFDNLTFDTGEPQ
jgi:hypothetical protein